VQKAATDAGRSIREALNDIIPRVRAILTAETDKLKCGDILRAEFDRISETLAEIQKTEKWQK
jgi:hypothetical protein